MASDTADNILWSQFTHPNVASAVQLSPQAQAALSRVTFSEMASPTPLQSVIQRAAMEAKTAGESQKSLFLVVGRGRRFAWNLIATSLINRSLHRRSRPSVVTKTIGEVGAGCVAAGTNISGMLVMQSAHDYSS
jgi:hypothetical protein